MISFPPCKINLGLQVLARRSDGYHEIETCFYPIPWTDILEIIPSDELRLTSSGIAIPGNASDNLCLKAYQLLKGDFNLSPVKIHLHKILPTGAGLGGGSSDAAHTLRLLNQIFDLKLSVEELRSYAARLGSDCPFFIEDKPMLGTGRGEILNGISVNLSGKFIVLVNPQLHISTQEAYAGVTPGLYSKHIKDIVTSDMDNWKKELRNDFETSVFTKHTVISEIKEKFYKQGACYSAMSGSGSTVFGIFKQPVDLRSQFPEMMYWGNVLG